MNSEEYHYKYEFLIGYGEVDEHNRMRLSSFLNYLQDVATMHSKTLGYGTTECKELGIAWMTLSWHIKMFYYPKGDTKIEVRTWCRGVKNCHAARAFEVFDDKKNKIAEIDSVWGLVNLETKRPMRPLDGMAEKYGSIDRMFFENEKVRITEPTEFDNELDFTIQRRDIDTNKHCNNAKYIEYALESVPDEVYQNKYVDELEIVYKHSVIYNEHIKIQVKETNENEYVSVIKKENGETSTVIRTKWM